MTLRAAGDCGRLEGQRSRALAAIVYSSRIVSGAICLPRKGWQVDLARSSAGLCVAWMPTARTRSADIGGRYGEYRG
jgi:hypothetical protein